MKNLALHFILFLMLGNSCSKEKPEQLPLPPFVLEIGANADAVSNEIALRAHINAWGDSEYGVSGIKNVSYEDPISDFSITTLYTRRLEVYEEDDVIKIYRFTDRTSTASFDSTYDQAEKVVNELKENGYKIDEKLGFIGRNKSKKILDNVFPRPMQGGAIVSLIKENIEITLGIRKIEKAYGAPKNYLGDHYYELKFTILDLNYVFQKRGGLKPNPIPNSDDYKLIASSYCKELKYIKPLINSSLSSDEIFSTIEQNFDSNRSYSAINELGEYLQPKEEAIEEFEKLIRKFMTDKENNIFSLIKVGISELIGEDWKCEFIDYYINNNYKGNEILLELIKDPQMTIQEFDDFITKWLVQTKNQLKKLPHDSEIYFIIDDSIDALGNFDQEKPLSDYFKEKSKMGYIDIGNILKNNFPDMQFKRVLFESTKQKIGMQLSGHTETPL